MSAIALLLSMLLQFSTFSASAGQPIGSGPIVSPQDSLGTQTGG